MIPRHEYVGVALALVLWGCAVGPAPHNTSAPGPEPVTRAWPVMGTMLQVTVWEKDVARARNALSTARAAVFRVDSLMSTYRPESELSAVNRRAGTDSLTRISHETAAVLTAALEYARASGGAFDVTVGPLVDVWGFYRPEGALPSPAALDSARALVGWETVEFDPARATVRLPRKGMRLDLGAIAKGYALDLSVAALREAGVQRGRVDLGGNLRFLSRAGGDIWEVGLRDPRRPEEALAAIRLDSGAVATSGDYERFFVHEGVRYSHILDPRTGWPALGVASVSAFAPTGLASDALSTALFVLGPDRGCALALAAGVEALWVLDGGERDGEVVITPGLRDRLAMYAVDPVGDGVGPQAAVSCESHLSAAAQPIRPVATGRAVVAEGEIRIA